MQRTVACSTEAHTGHRYLPPADMFSPSLSSTTPSAMIPVRKIKVLVECLQGFIKDPIMLLETKQAVKI